MPKVALADTLFEWESLLAAATEQGAGEGLTQFGVRPRRPYGRRATSRKASA